MGDSAQRLKYIFDLTPEGQAQQIHNLYNNTNYMHGKLDTLMELVHGQELKVERSNAKLLKDLTAVIKEEIKDSNEQINKKLSDLGEKDREQQKEIDNLKSFEANKLVKEREETRKMIKSVLIGTGMGTIITFAIQSIISLFH